jgi:sec-independent protein translocase protein TatC
VARKRAGQYFDDGSMSFGEHIEELRKHLVRAGLGVVAAMCFTAFFANHVVRAITGPLEGKLKEYHAKKLDRTGAEYAKTQQELEPDRRDRIALTLTLSTDTVRALALALGAKPPDAPPALEVPAEVESLKIVPLLARQLAEINQPWNIKTLSAQEPTVMYFKVALGSALVLACPWVFYQLYSFIAVGLYAHERRFFSMTVPFAVGLFLAGVAFCWFVMMPVMARFLLSVNEWMGLDPDIRLNEWVGFCITLMLVFGVAFQMPLLMVIAERVGLVTYELLCEKRRIAAFGIVIFSALATPTPDPLNQAMLALPLYGLYEVGLLALLLIRKRRLFSGDDAGPDDDQCDDLFANPVR